MQPGTSFPAARVTGGQHHNQKPKLRISIKFNHYSDHPNQIKLMMTYDSIQQTRPKKKDSQWVIDHQDLSLRSRPLGREAERMAPSVAPSRPRRENPPTCWVHAAGVPSREGNGQQGGWGSVLAPMSPPILDTKRTYMSYN